MVKRPAPSTLSTVARASTSQAARTARARDFGAGAGPKRVLERRASRLEGACVLLRKRPRHDAPEHVAHDQAAHSAVGLLQAHHPAQAHARKHGRRHRGSRELFRGAKQELCASLVVDEDTERLCGAPSRPGRRAPATATHVLQKALPAQGEWGGQVVAQTAGAAAAEGDGLGHAKLEVCLAQRAPWATR